ncbi:pancreatic triacylglycerol lipase-like [Rhynchophorus ferrugineus]|uniref:pancreatic triacylglycerol lipase-like n=1 Tax=Rhynchophorus ferrugineus TaxID=354439 RepID=UPI003FCD3E76
MLFGILCLTFALAASSLPLEDSTLGVSDKDVLFYFYSREHPDGIHVSIDESSDVAYIGSVFDNRKKTVVLIHGWKDGYGSDSNTYIRKSLLDAEDVNVIKVDWSKHAGKNYITAKNAVPKIGQISAKFFQNIILSYDYSVASYTLVGFSLGAHIVGNVGKYFNGTIPIIIGLDPAKPLVNVKDKSYALNTEDAQYVQIIHTDAGSAGLKDAIGHADFYPNDGKNQPGCTLKVGCSHARAWEYFAESITSNRFVSQKCDSYNKYKNNQCTGEYALMGGLYVDTSARGVYYLTTNSKSPYGRG